MFNRVFTEAGIVQVDDTVVVRDLGFLEVLVAKVEQFLAVEHFLGGA